MFVIFNIEFIVKNRITKNGVRLRYETFFSKTFPSHKVFFPYIASVQVSRRRYNKRGSPGESAGAGLFYQAAKNLPYQSLAAGREMQTNHYL